MSFGQLAPVCLYWWAQYESGSRFASHPATKGATVVIWERISFAARPLNQEERLSQNLG